MPTPEEKLEVAIAVKNYHTVAMSICAKLEAAGTTGDTLQTIIAIQNRMIHAVDAVQLLDRLEDSRSDQALLLRGMYDLHIQTLFLLSDPATNVPDYLDFMRVEQFEWGELLTSSKTVLAKNIMAQSAIGQAISDRTADYNAVKHRFLTNSGKKCRPHWYKGTLADLADKVNRREEYDIMQKILSQVVHSSSIAMTRPLMIPDMAFIHDAWIVTLRVLGAMAACLKITLDARESAMVKSVNGSIF